MARRGGEHHLVDDGAGVLRVLFEILVERGAHGLRDGRHDLAVAQLGLGLAFELRLGHLDGDDGREAFAEVGGVEVELEFRQEAVLVGVALEGGGQAAAETAQVRTALDGVDVVDVGMDVLAEARVVLHGDFDGNHLVGFEIDGLLGKLLADAVEVLDEFHQAVFGIEHFLAGLLRKRVAVFVEFDFAGAQVTQREADAFVQVGQFAEAAGEDVVVIDQDGEDFLVGLEGDDGTRVGGLPYHLDVVEGLALGILLHEDLAFPVDFGRQVRGKGVDAGDAHAVETAGHLVAVLAELTAGVEHGQHHFEGAALLFFVEAGRDASAVIGYPDRVVRIDGHYNIVAISGQRFVDRVVNHLIDQMMQAAGTDVADVHRRTFADGFQAFENLDTVGRIVFVLLH